MLTQATKTRSLIEFLRLLALLTSQIDENLAVTC